MEEEMMAQQQMQAEAQTASAGSEGVGMAKSYPENPALEQLNKRRIDELVEARMMEMEKIKAAVNGAREQGMAEGTAIGVDTGMKRGIESGMGMGRHMGQREVMDGLGLAPAGSGFGSYSAGLSGEDGDGMDAENPTEEMSEARGMLGGGEGQQAVERVQPPVDLAQRAVASASEYQE